MCAAHAVAFKAEPTLQPRLPEEQEFRFPPFSRLPAFTQAGLWESAPEPWQAALERPVKILA